MDELADLEGQERFAAECRGRFLRQGDYQNAMVFSELSIDLFQLRQTLFGTPDFVDGSSGL
jgi:hypothetical protein